AFAIDDAYRLLLFVDLQQCLRRRCIEAALLEFADLGALLQQGPLAGHYARIGCAQTAGESKTIHDTRSFSVRIVSHFNNLCLPTQLEVERCAVSHWRNYGMNRWRFFRPD